MNVFGMAGHLIRRLNQLSTQVFMHRMQAAGYDLTPVQFAALDAIHANPGLDQASVAARIAYDKATIGGVIDRLESKGYVERSVSKSDRRAREVTLTNLGGKTYDAILPIVKELQAEILSGLTPEEQDQLIRLATKAIQAGSSDPK
ncbi:MarR family transcriptional regulator [Ruegeria pomeroyi]|uniref:MarR family winged helix-turn-helix transcriptional regulator n=1 Tax=Ruegeria pomeroyi TaxID=89184 RepID=UPI001F46702A|nr:MarR family transcriptional regulator [Ruegeria pomeroyi]MCE8510694.1 MarR family transcriptional regulator [Ruegeria pomeroyi]